MPTYQSTFPYTDMSKDDFTKGFITLEESLFKDGDIGVRERYVYAFLRTILGDREGVISYYEIARRTKVSIGKVTGAVKRLEERGYLIKMYVYHKVEEGVIGRKLRLKALCLNPFPVPKKVIFDEELTPEEKGLLLTLYYLSTPEKKVFMSRSRIAKEAFSRTYSAPLLKNAFLNLENKGRIKKERFWYVIVDDNE